MPLKPKLKSKKVQSKSVSTPEYIPELSDETALALIEEKRTLDDTIKTLSARKSEIAEQIKMIAEKRGVKNDKGSFVFTIRNESGELYGLSKTKASSISFNPSKAIAFLKANYPALAKKLISHETVEVLTEDVINQAIMAKKLKVKDLDSMVDCSESYSARLYKITENEEELAEIEVRKERKSSEKKEKPQKNSVEAMPKVKVSSNSKLMRRGR